jgi:predicted HTH transcriptional regulator
VRRNENLARLFHDLKLMEREGSGFDKIYEVLLSQERPAPDLIESHDRVRVNWLPHWSCQGLGQLAQQRYLNGIE